MRHFDVLSLLFFDGDKGDGIIQAKAESTMEMIYRSGEQ